MKVQYKNGLKGLGMALLLGVSLNGYAIQYGQYNTDYLHNVTFANTTNVVQKVTVGGIAKGSVPAKGSLVVNNVSLMPKLNGSIVCSDSTWKNDSNPRTCTISASACACK